MFYFILNFKLFCILRSFTTNLNFKFFLLKISLIDFSKFSSWIDTWIFAFLSDNISTVRKTKNDNYNLLITFKLKKKLSILKIFNNLIDFIEIYIKKKKKNCLLTNKIVQILNYEKFAIFLNNRRFLNLKIQ